MFPLGDAEEMKTRLLQLEQENTKVIAGLWIVCQIRQGIRKKKTGNVSVKIYEKFENAAKFYTIRPTVHTLIRNGAFKLGELENAGFFSVFVKVENISKTELDDGVTILGSCEFLTEFSSNINPK